MFEDQPGRFGDRSLHNDVYAVVIDLIHSGKLQPGDRISEAEIARNLGISRAPVREAINRLSYEGLVIRRPRRGSVIREFSRKNIEDIQDTRMLIEGHAAYRAALRIKPDDIDLLENLIQLMKDAAERGQFTEAASTNAMFHESVVRISDNTILYHLWQSLNPLAWLMASVVRPSDQHDPEDLVTRHRALLDALSSRDPHHAMTMFQEHVSRAGQEVLSRREPPTRSEAVDQPVGGGSD